MKNNELLFPYSIRDVHISDPFILADDKTHLYYTYVQFADTERFPDAKADTPCFYVLKSPDLFNWSEPKVCFEKGTFWADKDYWAPECHIWKDKYYIISSFRADGKYRGCQCLDGTLFIDDEGSPWLVFCHEWIQEEIPLYALDGGHAMLFKAFNGRLMMSLHCPNIHEKKRMLLFEMEEIGDKLAIVNEITGNWYNGAGGSAKNWRYDVPCTEELGRKKL